MWKFYCDCCEREVKNGEAKYRIALGKEALVQKNDKVVQRLICEDCANKVLDFLGGESEE